MHATTTSGLSNVAPARVAAPCLPWLPYCCLIGGGCAPSAGIDCGGFVCCELFVNAGLPTACCCTSALVLLVLSGWLSSLATQRNQVGSDSGDGAEITHERERERKDLQQGHESVRGDIQRGLIAHGG